MSGETIERVLKVLIAIVLLILVAGGTVFYFIVRPPAIKTGGNLDEPIEREAGVYNILIVGTDKVALNTDTIVVLSLDTAKNKASVMSIPRDTMSNVSRNVKKINAAYGVGGSPNINQLKTEIRYLMGFEVDNYIVVNLEAFEEIIDALGGVTIDVQQDMHYEDPYQDLYIHIDKGLQTLNGEEAVGFVRYRKGYVEGDIGRVKAQQQFIEALAKQVATPATVSKLPKLSSIILENMTTDLTTGELVWFGTQALELNMAEDLTMHILPGEARMVSGLSYYVPDEKAILELVNNYFNPYPNLITQLNVVDVASLPPEVEETEEEIEETVEEVGENGEVLEESSDEVTVEGNEEGTVNTEEGNEATEIEAEEITDDEQNQVDEVLPETNVTENEEVTAGESEVLEEEINAEVNPEDDNTVEAGNEAEETIEVNGEEDSTEENTSEELPEEEGNLP